MGEFHFSRYPSSEWREELLKIKAGGISVVATYVFWNIHEERQGRFDWSGDRNLRRFVTLCAETGLDMVLRVGPWAHGESRYGGFPDWLMAADCRPRTDDPRYLALVAPYLKQISAQVRGLTRAAGGPIVAVQVENELYDQPGHLLTIKRMTQEAGIDAPLWTATGWGHAQLPADELIPLFGGYSEAAWDTAHDGWPQQSRAHYFFGPGRDDDSIGADLRTGGADEAESGTAWPSSGLADEAHLVRYPFATCELGGGMYTSYHRRPIIQPADIAALALVKIGSGSAWQGYYLYHGASQKVGELSTLQESHATGYPNDCPVINYDFQAPLGEYGQFRESYAHLRLQHLWLGSDGADLATMTLTMPQDAPADTADREKLRWAVRSDGRSGFLFVNNHQPVETLPDHEGVKFEVELGDRRLTVPRHPVTVPSGAYFAWPLARTVGSALLLSATAQPVCMLEGEEPVLVLARTFGIPVELVLGADTVRSVDGPATVTSSADGVVLSDLEPGTDCLLRVTAADGSSVVIIVIDEESALTAHRVRLAGRDRLLLSSRPAVPDGELITLYGTAEEQGVRVFPALTGEVVVDGMPVIPVLDGVFSRLDLGAAQAWPQKLEVVQLAEADSVRKPVIDAASGRASAPQDADFEGAAVYRVVVPPEAFHGDEEVLLRVRWTGDVGRACIGDRLVADQFWYGPAWEIGLRRFKEDVLSDGVELELLPLAEVAPVYISPQVRPAEYPDGALLTLESVEAVRVPRTVLSVREA